MAQTLRPTNDLRQQQGLLPEQLAEGLAIPVGTEDNGQQRFLSNFGLTHEDALSTLQVGPKGGERTAANVLSNLNPMLKGILEYATGRQLYSGKDLEEVSRRGLTGNILVDQVLM